MTRRTQYEYEPASIIIIVIYYWSGRETVIMCYHSPRWRIQWWLRYIVRRAPPYSCFVVIVSLSRLSISRRKYRLPIIRHRTRYDTFAFHTQNGPRTECCIITKTERTSFTLLQPFYADSTRPLGLSAGTSERYFIVRFTYRPITLFYDIWNNTVM